MGEHVNWAIFPPKETSNTIFSFFFKIKKVLNEWGNMQCTTQMPQNKNHPNKV